MLSLDMLSTEKVKLTFDFVSYTVYLCTVASSWLKQIQPSLILSFHFPFTQPNFMNKYKDFQAVEIENHTRLNLILSEFLLFLMCFHHSTK